MTIVYIIEDCLANAAFAIDAEESIHVYDNKNELYDVVSRGQFFGSDLDFYEIEGEAAAAFLAERGW